MECKIGDILNKNVIFISKQAYWSHLVRVGKDSPLVRLLRIHYSINHYILKMKLVSGGQGRHLGFQWLQIIHSNKDEFRACGSQ